MRKHQPKPGQIGDYWLSKKSDRKGQNDAWCRTWYDAKSRQTCRVSLGTSDFHEASTALADWFVRNQSVTDSRPDQVLIEHILIRYWEKHAQHLPSANTQKLNLAKWQEFWAGKTVSQIKPDQLDAFHVFLGLGRVKTSSIDRALSVGRAAFSRAVRRNELDAAPYIGAIETSDERYSRDPMGRPITVAEMAKLFDAAGSRHLFVYLVMAATTLARPGAILDARCVQYDRAHQLINMNPPGRIQNKKFRPQLPVVPTLRPWLDRVNDPDSYLISVGGKKIKSITSTFKTARKRAGLDPEITPYSFRHGMAREMRKRRVNLDEIGLFLGHRPRGSNATTSIYAPLEPEYCSAAVDAIEDVLAEVRKALKSVSLDDPSALIKTLDNSKSSRGHLSDVQTGELIAAIQAGVPAKDLAERFAISTTAVYHHRHKLGIRCQ